MEKDIKLYIEGSGHPLFFINGLYNDKSAWTPYLKTLKASHTVIRFDWFASERPIGFFEQANYLREIFEKLGLDPGKTTAVGLSAGANLLRYIHTCDRAIEFKSLVLLAPSPGGLLAFYRQLHDNYLHLIELYGVEVYWRSALHTFFSPEFFTRNPGIYEVLIASFCATYKDQKDAICTLIRSLFEDPTLDNPPTQFRCPTLVLQADQDFLVPQEFMKRYLERCSGSDIRFETVKGGHAFPFENVIDTLKRITSFLLETQH